MMELMTEVRPAHPQQLSFGVALGPAMSFELKRLRSRVEALRMKLTEGDRRGREAVDLGVLLILKPYDRKELGVQECDWGFGTD